VRDRLRLNPTGPRGCTDMDCLARPNLSPNDHAGAHDWSAVYLACLDRVEDAATACNREAPAQWQATGALAMPGWRAMRARPWPTVAA